jgi:hypothetical protein
MIMIFHLHRSYRRFDFQNSMPIGGGASDSFDFIGNNEWMGYFK